LMQVGLVPQNTVLLEQKDIMLQLENQSSSVTESVKELESSTLKKKIKRAK
jgi:hypothetical protein